MRPPLTPLERRLIDYVRAAAASLPARGIEDEDWDTLASIGLAVDALFGDMDAVRALAEDGIPAPEDEDDGRVG